MLFDHLLALVALKVEPFAVCDIRTGSRLRMDESDSATLHFVFRGRGTLRAGPHEHELDAYSLALVPPGLSHSVESAPDSVTDIELSEAELAGVQRIVSGSGATGLVMACGAVRVELSSMGLFERLSMPLVEPFSDAPRLRQLFDEIFEEQTETRLGQVRMIEAIMMQCLVHLFRRLVLRPPDDLGWLKALDDPRLSRVLDAVVARPGTDHSLQGLAELAGMSRSSFSAHFTESFGQSPMSFVKAVRLQEAARLLRQSDLPIKAIAARVGFQSRSHFSKAFKDQFHRDPAGYRGGSEE